MFAKILEELCDKKGIKFSKLAKDIGCSAATATGWKRGSVPKHETLKKIADYFSVSVKYLQGEPKQAPLVDYFTGRKSLLDDKPLIVFDSKAYEDSTAIGDTVHEPPKKAKMKTSVDFQAITVEIDELCKMGTKGGMPVTGSGIGRLLILHLVCKHNGVILPISDDIGRLTKALPNIGEHDIYIFFARLYYGLEDCRERAEYDLARIFYGYCYKIKDELIYLFNQFQEKHDDAHWDDFCRNRIKLLGLATMSREDAIESFRNILRYNDLISACADELGISALIGARIDTADLLTDIEKYNEEIDRMKTFLPDIEESLKKINNVELMRQPPRRAIKNMRERIHSPIYTLASNLRHFIYECRFVSGVVVE